MRGSLKNRIHLPEDGGEAGEEQAPSSSPLEAERSPIRKSDSRPADLSISLVPRFKRDYRLGNLAQTDDRSPHEGVHKHARVALP